MNHKTMVGAIVGGTIGGSIVLFSMLLLLVLIIRQRRRIATAAPLPKPFEEPSRDSTQTEDRQDVQRDHRGKHLMPPPGSETTNVPRNDSALGESYPPTQEHAESQGITIGSLIWELNELLRRNNRAVREESLPTYAASQSETLASN
jgi:predicted lipid-binding transport protein (Tim44 family)